ncbi:MAG: CIA30 family protein [Phycisphaerae bacterium]|nr:CIA30 family protein [Phycisphaerae bacterium]
MSTALAVWLLVVTPGAVDHRGPAQGQVTMSERLLFAFDVPDAARKWVPVNDTVMGGVSTSTCRVTESGTLQFNGEVSLANNGGFASIRTGTSSLDLSSYDEFVLRIRSDGKRYALSVSTDYPIAAGAYYFNLKADAGEWREIRVPFHSFQARSFGRRIPGAPPMNTADIRAVGFIISDKQAGPFLLEIDWIKAASRQGD